MAVQLQLGDISADLVFKNIKNIHLSVLPPAGKVRISAPLKMKTDTIRVFAISKLGWIKQQQKKFLNQDRETPREYLERESHYVWGRRYLLTIRECDEAPTVQLKYNHLLLNVRPGTEEPQRQDIMEEWYRRQIHNALPPLLAKWEKLMGVKVARVFVRKMKTKWGSCNPTKHSIRLNTDLAKKPPECLEYLVVHELAHLREPTHNTRFVAWMDQFMPKWQTYRALLNRLPIRHEHWDY